MVRLCCSDILKYRIINEGFNLISRIGDWKMINRKERRVNFDLLVKKLKNYIFVFVLKCLFWMFYYINILNEYS